MAKNFEILKAHILPLSQSKNFYDAKEEWVLFDVEYIEDWDECPCSKDIKEKCYIKNQLNGNITHVGNHCIKKFIEIDTGNLFGGLKKIIKDPTANPNRDLIIQAYKLGYLYGEREYTFLMSLRGKRKFSAAQYAWKIKINRRIINKIVVRRK